jgi:hypothetical protein
MRGGKLGLDVRVSDSLEVDIRRFPEATGALEGAIPASGGSRAQMA